MRLGEKVPDAGGERGDQRRRDPVPAGQSRGERQILASGTIYLDSARLGVEYPVFLHAMLAIEAPLDGSIQPGILGAGRDDLDRQIGRAGNTHAGCDFLTAFRADEGEVGDDSAVLVEDDACTRKKLAGLRPASSARMMFIKARMWGRPGAADT